jgi:tetratricopeptide (TPR) repeat protein
MFSSRANELNEQGLLDREAGRLDEALICFSQASQEDPTDSASFANAGLIYKAKSDWRDMLHCFQEASKRAIGIDEWKQKSIWWNLGIAATAMRDWATARTAWKALGFPIEPGSAPPHMSLGRALLVAPYAAGRFEAERIDPCRSRIKTVAPPPAAVAFHDIVVQDAEPLERVQTEGGVVSVFRVLEILERGQRVPFRATIAYRSERDLEAFEAFLAAVGAGSNVREVGDLAPRRRQCWIYGRGLEQIREQVTRWQELDLERTVIELAPVPLDQPS